MLDLKAFIHMIIIPNLIGYYINAGWGFLYFNIVLVIYLILLETNNDTKLWSITKEKRKYLSFAIFGLTGLAEYLVVLNILN